MKSVLINLVSLMFNKIREHLERQRFKRETNEIMKFMSLNLDSQLKLSSAATATFQAKGSLTYTNETDIFKDFRNFVYYKKKFLGETNYNMLSTLVEVERSLRKGEGVVYLVDSNEIIRNYASARFKEILQ